MAAMAAAAMGWREGSEVSMSEKGAEGSSVSASGGRSGTGMRLASGSEQGMWQQWWARSAHDSHVPYTRRPFRPLRKQVACDRVTPVGHIFGLALVRFRPRALNQSC
jgi:hypothetical protein